MHSLVGYNIDDNQLKAKVLQAIHGLRRSGRVYGIYRQYVVTNLPVEYLPDPDEPRYADAPDWRELVNVFMKSLSDSTLDEMILLLHSKAPKYRGSVSRHARTVFYENVEEIPDRLHTKAAGRTETPVGPPSFPTPEGRTIGFKNDDGQEKHPELPEEEAPNPGDSEPSVDNLGQEGASVTPEEIRAVLTIEAAYHRVMTRRKATLGSIDATRVRLWCLLRDRASSMEWPRHKQYKLLMQGPLVHVLVCLDGIKMFADQANKNSKKQLQKADHRGLEELIERSDRSR